VEKKYGFVIVDDFSRFTWVLFLKHKNDYFEAFQTFCKKVQNEKETNIISVRSNHRGEFENSSFEQFFSDNGISHNFSCPRTLMSKTASVRFCRSSKNRVSFRQRIMN